MKRPPGMMIFELRTAGDPLARSFLFGIKFADPAALAVSVTVLLAAAILAGYAPAWRASRIDPMSALRHE